MWSRDELSYRSRVYPVHRFGLPRAELGPARKKKKKKGRRNVDGGAERERTSTLLTLKPSLFLTKTERRELNIHWREV